MKLTDNIHLLRIDFDIQLTPEKKIPRFVNVLIIFSDTITLVDTGVKGSEKQIFNYLREQNRDSSEISTIILSHSHPDHIGSAAKIKEVSNCKVLAHQHEKGWIENIDLQHKQRPVPGFYNLVDEAVLVDKLVSENDSIKIEDGLTLKFIVSAGHSKGSLNIEFVENRILFTADSIPLKKDIPNYDNYLELMDSLNTIKTNTKIETLLTSWTLPLTNRDDILKLIDEGENYMNQVDSVVKACYINTTPNSLDSCKRAVEALRLPSFLVTPVVDKAFRSHLK